MRNKGALYMGRKDENGKDGFKFAITAITALVTFSYLSYNYFQNTAVNGNLYSVGLVIITTVVVSILILLFYIFIKGLAIELQDSCQKEKLEKLASDIFRKFFLIGLILFIYSSLFYYMYTSILYHNEIDINIIYIILVLVAVFSLYLHNKYMKRSSLDIFIIEENIKQSWNKFNSDKQDSFINKILISIGNTLVPIRNMIMAKIISIKPHHPKLYRYLLNLGIDTGRTKFVTFCLFEIFMLYLIVFLVIASLMPGDALIDIGSIHYKSTPIPVSIKITGPDTGLSINLLKENYEHNLTQIDQIKLEPFHNPNTIFGNNTILLGNSMENGIYNVFINTTNLTEGYYELVCFRNYQYIKGFYLINK